MSGQISRPFDPLGRDPDQHFERFADIRAQRKEFLAKSERWLTPYDIIQDGDSYMANGKDWWEFTDGNINFDQPMVGKLIILDCFCYTPKGKKIRVQ